MNIIDDFSSFVWSILLKDKSSAFKALCDWQRLRENETGEKVGRYRTDHSELCSTQMERWLAECGIHHDLTAPATSAQNGRSE